MIASEVGHQPPSDLIRGGRSRAARTDAEGLSGSLDNFPVIGSQSVLGLARRTGDPSAPCRPLRRPARAAAGTFAPVLLRSGLALLAGVVLAQAFEPVGLALLLPLGVAGLVLCRPRAAGAPRLAARPRVRHRLPVRPAVLDARRRRRPLAGPGRARGRVLRRRWGRRPPCCCAGAAGPLWFARRLGGDRDDPLGLAVQRACRGAGCPTPWRARPGRTRLPYVGMAGVSFLLALLGALLAPRASPGAGADPWPSAGSPPWSRRSSPAAGARAVRRGPTIGDAHASPWSRATSRATAPTSCSTTARSRATTSTRRCELADRVESGEQPAPDFVVWPENSTAVDPFLDDDVNAGIQRGQRGGAGADPGRRDGRRRDRARPQPGHRLGARTPARRTATPSGTRCPFGEYIPWRDLGLGSIGQLRLIPRDMLGGSRERAAADRRTRWSPTRSASTSPTTTASTTRSRPAGSC